MIRGGPLVDSSLIARLIGHATLITCATPAYLKAFGVPAYPDELRNGHRLVSYLSPQTGKPFPLRFERQGEKIEITSAHRIGVNESNAHLAAGLARAWESFRHLIIRCRRFCGREKWLRSCTTGVRRVIRFIWFIRQNRHVTQRLRVFIDWLVECFPARVAGEGKSGT
ncbi:transcriptional regulator [Pantoea agglomerans]|uniref:Transcriptional regulator n=1 Tax=Enterobacter agglomerans TaxID=549 RepID=A0A379AFZ5_ENTAG|nr:transcriptional regulator [Pantoea agglomerans]